MSDIVLTVFDKLHLDDLIEARLTPQYTIRFDEVAFWLDRIHAVASVAVRSAYTDQADDAVSRFRDVAGSLDVRHLIPDMRAAAKADIENAWKETIRYSVAQDILRKRRLGLPEDDRDEYSRFLIFDFPKRYLEQLPRLLYPDWY